MEKDENVDENAATKDDQDKIKNYPRKEKKMKVEDCPP